MGEGGLNITGGTDMSSVDVFGGGELAGTRVATQALPLRDDRLMTDGTHVRAKGGSPRRNARARARRPLTEVEKNARARRRSEGGREERKREEALAEEDQFARRERLTEGERLAKEEHRVRVERLMDDEECTRRYTWRQNNPARSVGTLFHQLAMADCGALLPIPLFTWWLPLGAHSPLPVLAPLPPFPPKWGVGERW